jgi:hypothetical protein
LAVAEITTKNKDEALFLEERERLGLEDQKAIDRQHAYLMHKEKLESAERIAQMGVQQRAEAADKAARAKRSVQFTKGPDGAVQSATITGDEMAETSNNGAGA